MIIKILLLQRANIQSKNWNLDKVSLVDKRQQNNFKSYVYNSSFNGEIN